MATAERRPAGADRLRPAIVVGTTEDTCTVIDGDGRRVSAPYALPFPRPRVERVTPGNLVVIASSDHGEVIVWRWFDAVVVDRAGAEITLWEPLHAVVAARIRDPGHAHRPGGRAYMSAGLPGAEWWVVGPAVDDAKDADVDLDEVLAFYTDNGLWEHLT